MNTVPIFKSFSINQQEHQALEVLSALVCSAVQRNLSAASAATTTTAIPFYTFNSPPPSSPQRKRSATQVFVSEESEDTDIQPGAAEVSIKNRKRCRTTTVPNTESVICTSKFPFKSFSVECAVISVNTQLYRVLRTTTLLRGNGNRWIQYIKQHIPPAEQARYFMQCNYWGKTKQPEYLLLSPGIRFILQYKPHMRKYKEFFQTIILPWLDQNNPIQQQ